jgi:hypothetical protein
MYSVLLDHEVAKSINVMKNAGQAKPQEPGEEKRNVTLTDNLEFFKSTESAPREEASISSTDSTSVSTTKTQDINISLSFNECVVKVNNCARKRLSEIENEKGVELASSMKSASKKRVKRVPFAEKTNSMLV